MAFFVIWHGRQIPISCSFYFFLKLFCFFHTYVSNLLSLYRGNSINQLMKNYNFTSCEAKREFAYCKMTSYENLRINKTLHLITLLYDTANENIPVSPVSFCTFYPIAALSCPENSRGNSLEWSEKPCFSAMLLSD